MAANCSRWRGVICVALGLLATCCVAGCGMLRVDVESDPSGALVQICPAKQFRHYMGWHLGGDPWLDFASTSGPYITPARVLRPRNSYFRVAKEGYLPSEGYEIPDGLGKISFSFTLTPAPAPPGVMTRTEALQVVRDILQQYVDPGAHVTDTGFSANVPVLIPTDPVRHRDGGSSHYYVRHGAVRVRVPFAEVGKITLYARTGRGHKDGMPMIRISSYTLSLFYAGGSHVPVNNTYSSEASAGLGGLPFAHNPFVLTFRRADTPPTVMDLERWLRALETLCPNLGRPMHKADATYEWAANEWADEAGASLIDLLPWRVSPRED